MCDGDVVIKLLSLWALDFIYETNAVEKNIISHGIWEVYGVKIEEKTDLEGNVHIHRIYTLMCVAPASEDLKIGDIRTMHEQTILYLCHPIKIIHMPKIKGYEN